MTTIARDRLVLTLDFFVDKALQSMGLLEQRMFKLGSSMSKFSERKFFSISDAIDSTFGKAVKGSDAVGRAVQRTTDNFDKLASNQPFSLAEMGIDKVSTASRKLMFSEKLLMSVEKQMAKARIAGIRTLDRMSTSLKKATVNMSMLKQGMMSFGLSALFTGMAIKRFASTVIRSVTNTFMELTDNTNAAHAGIMGLRASFEFLKFIIFDALSRSDLFMGFVFWLTEMADKLGIFIDDHPKIAVMMGAFVLLGLVLGSIFMVLGQTVLAFLGLIGAGEIWAAIGLKGVFGRIGLAVGPLVGKIIKLTFAFFGLDAATLFLKGGIILNALTKIGFAIGWLTGKMITFMFFSPWGLIALAIGFVIFQFFKLKDEVGSFGNAWKIIMLSIKLALAKFVDFAIVSLNKVMDAFRPIVEALQKKGFLRGISFQAIPELNLADSFQGELNSLIAKITLDKLDKEEEMKKQTAALANPASQFSADPDAAEEAYNVKLDKASIEALATMNASKQQNIFSEDMERNGLAHLLPQP